MSEEEERQVPEEAAGWHALWERRPLPQRALRSERLHLGL
jgi:hypothetical protein